MNDSHTWLPALLRLPIFRSEWVLYLLLATSLVSLAVMLERWWFYRRRRFDVESHRGELSARLADAERGSFTELLAGSRALEARVLLAGVTRVERGADAVEQAMLAELGREKRRYEQGLDVLATIASNAPYVGLLGTVLGIVRAFRDLAANLAEASSSVMAGIAEALIATAVGLLVAIPALVAFNVFKARVRGAVGSCQDLMRDVLAELRAE